MWAAPIMHATNFLAIRRAASLSLLLQPVSSALRRPYPRRASTGVRVVSAPLNLLYAVYIGLRPRCILRKIFRIYSSSTHTFVSTLRSFNLPTTPHTHISACSSTAPSSSSVSSPSPSWPKVRAPSLFSFCCDHGAELLQVSAFILPLTRYMLDAVPEDAETPDAAAKLVPADAANPSSAAADTGADIPVTAESSPGEDGQEDATEPSAPASDVGDAESTTASAADVSTPSAASQMRIEQSNAAGHIVVLSSTTVLVASIVAGILVAA
ncbi:hypothetical protein C8Q80DRAFT_596344 [Daedaleopsis nitida]|nr:hypothetical protein C8Q80DRAFT_596344 [Daedaleopsis nitida]